ncbi:MAG: cytochrome c oxidase accessory protein CcoG [Pseudomonadota bacterium]
MTVTSQPAALEGGAEPLHRGGGREPARGPALPPEETPPENFALYKKREQIYPKLVNGKFRALKWGLLAATLGIYYLLPWVRWPRAAGEPDQAVLVDFAGGRFYFFFIEIWPSELYYVTGLLILAAVGLFLATALLGRVWCGYACPQTVWTDLFIAVERLIEGDRNARIRLARADWSASKAMKKIAKHAIWLLIAAATGGAWVLYFHDAPTVVGELFTGAAPGSAYLFLGVLTFTTYVLAGTMREQVCIYMCPWPRIQAALTDEETLQVTYRYDRGEPRGAHKKGDSWDARGDCVDCKACVVACPMGIDIRDGAQLECINCALCIDACDDIMAKVGRPTGLVAYDTDQNIVRRERSQKTTVKLFRARTAFYGGVFLLVSAIMVFGLTSRATVETSVLRDRTPPFVLLSDGSIRNAYTVKITNKANAERAFEISAVGPDGVVLTGVGLDVRDNTTIVRVAGDDVRALRLFATASPEGLKSSEPLAFRVKETTSGETAVNDSVFLSARSR